MTDFDTLVMLWIPLGGLCLSIVVLCHMAISEPQNRAAYIWDKARRKLLQAFERGQQGGEE